MSEKTIQISRTESVTILKVGNVLGLTVTDSGGCATAYFLTQGQQVKLCMAIACDDQPQTRYFVDGLRAKGV